MRLPYLEFEPALTEPAALASSAVVAGRTSVGPGLALGHYATLRADGEAIRIGANGFFGPRATVHIAEGAYEAIVGDDVSVGRFGLVHACTLGDGVIVADAATVMDACGDARVDHAGIGRPRAQSGHAHAGSPAMPVRSIHATSSRARGARCAPTPRRIRHACRAAASPSAPPPRRAWLPTGHVRRTDARRWYGGDGREFRHHFACS
jgi:carbonic anhydrase/acetyltransferase-like protein (isoleucine patch superfamily)